MSEKIEKQKDFGLLIVWKELSFSAEYPGGTDTCEVLDVGKEFSSVVRKILSGTEGAKIVREDDKEYYYRFSLSGELSDHQKTCLLEF